MAQTAGNINKTESVMVDKNGIPIPILGISSNDTLSSGKTGAINTNTTITLGKDSLFMVVIAQADTTDMGILIVDILAPSDGSKTFRFASSSGSIVLILKGRALNGSNACDMKITHVASPNSTGFIASVIQLA